MNDIFMAKVNVFFFFMIIVEQYDKRYIVESPYSDGNLIEELPELVYDILLMVGYQQDTVNKALVELAEERGFKFDNEED